MDNPDQSLFISLLGPFSVAVNGEPLIGFESQKSRALLAYLAVEAEQNHSRSTLATLLWPEATANTARKNLRQALYNLRQTLSEIAAADLLHITPQVVRFSPGAGVQVDVRTFAELLETSKRHPHRRLDSCPACRERLRQAVQLYGGDFLAGFSLPDADEFEGWLQRRRDQYRAAALDALDELAAYYERAQEYGLAQGYYERQRDIEPWRERAHQGLMRVYALLGHHAAAQRQYEKLCDILRQELDCEPSAESVALAKSVRQQSVQRQTLDDNPYKGLQAFTEADAADFFGREDMVGDLVALVSAQALTVVMGASGSGKSSIIQAGLLSRLRHDLIAGHERWRIASFRPGKTPYQTLAKALATLGTIASSPAEIADLLEAADASLTHLLAPPAGERILLVVDQFEELFTECTDVAARRRFLKLLTADDPQREGLAVLLSLRADFAGEALAYRSLADPFQHSSLVVGPMNREELARSIVMPARARGVVFEAGLVSRLLDDAGDQPGNLPLLQFALTLLWERHTGGTLTHADYDFVGGVRGALASHAEKIFGRLTPAEQGQMRRIFLRAVRPGEGVPDTRRMLVAAEISEADWRLVQRLADERLLVTDRDAAGRETAELAHEALIHHWDRLKAWLENDHRFRFWHTRLRATLEQWQSVGQDEGGLLRGLPLAEAETWMQTRAEDLTAAEKTFIAAGLAHRQRLQHEAEARQQRELTHAQALAAAEHERAEMATRGRRRLRLVAGALAVTMILGLLAAFSAYQQAQEAQRQALKAHARQLSAQAQHLAPFRLDTALLLALESLRLSDSPAEDSDLMIGLGYNPMIAIALHGGDGPLHSIAFRDGHSAEIVVSAEGVTHVWHLQEGGEPETLLQTTPGSFSFAWLSPDGRRAAAMTGTEIILWDLTRGAQIATLTEHLADVDFMSFSRDGSRLVTGSKDGALILRDAEDGAPLAQFRYDGSGGMALAPGGERLAMFDDFPQGAGVEIWDMTTGRQVSGPFYGHKGSIHSMVYSPDGLWLATTGFDKTVRLRDGRTGEPVGDPLIGHAARVLSAAFSPDSTLLATGGGDNKIILWDVASGQALDSPLSGHSNWVRALAFSADGRFLTSADASGEVLVWDLGKRQLLAGHTDRVRGVAFSPDGGEMITSSFDATLRAWDADGQLLALFPPAHSAAITTLAYSPDGRVIASADASGMVILWDAKTRQPLHPPLTAHESVIISLAFTAEGAILASGDFAGVINLWDVAAGQRLGAPTQAHEGAWVLALAFSPDGRLLASGGTDAEINLWQTANISAGRAAALTLAAAPLTAHENWITSLLFSDDSRLLISGSGDGAIRLWDAGSGEAVGRPLLGHAAQVWGVQFYRPHGNQTLVSLGGDGSIFWWDLATRQPIAPPLHTFTETETFALSPDGSRLLLGALAETAQLWRLDQRPWREQACSIANRTLTAAEWQTFMGDLPYEPACAPAP